MRAQAASGESRKRSGRPITNATAQRTLKIFRKINSVYFTIKLNLTHKMSTPISCVTTGCAGRGREYFGKRPHIVVAKGQMRRRRSRSREEVGGLQRTRSRPAAAVCPREPTCGFRRCACALNGRRAPSRRPVLAVLRKKGGGERRLESGPSGI